MAFILTNLKMNKNKILRLLYLSILICCLLSCKDGLFDSGMTITREIKIEQPFSTLDFKNIFDVVLVQDTINKVLVSCGKNLQSYVSVDVSNDVLIVNQDTKFNWSRKYEKIKLEIHLTAIPNILIHEPVNLKSKGTLKGDNFSLVDYGKVSEVDVTVDVNTCAVYMTFDNFGSFKVKGKCNYAEFWGWGSSIVRADSLIAGDCYVLQRGIGNVYVNVINQLSVSLNYSGNVYYTGNPAEIIIKEQKSTGQLIKM